MTRPARKYVLDTQLFINAFRDPVANEALQRFQRALSPFERLSVIVAQELRAGVKQPSDRTALERKVLRVLAGLRRPTRGSRVAEAIRTIELPQLRS